LHDFVDKIAVKAATTERTLEFDLGSALQARVTERMNTENQRPSSIPKHETTVK
jgi:hypothetical protein